MVPITRLEDVFERSYQIFFLNWFNSSCIARDQCLSMKYSLMSFESTGETKAIKFYTWLDIEEHFLIFLLFWFISFRFWSLFDLDIYLYSCIELFMYLDLLQEFSSEKLQKQRTSSRKGVRLSKVTCMNSSIVLVFLKIF